MRRLIVEDSINIDVPSIKVWQVLTRPEFIRQWDDVPEEFSDDFLQIGSEFVWKREGGGFTKLTVVAFEPYKYLRQLWYVSDLEQSADWYNIGYAYTLSEEDHRTTLSVTIGDWAKLANGKDYYDASIEFAQAALQKIKELAER